MEPAVENALSELFQAGNNLRQVVGETFPEGALATWIDHGHETSFQQNKNYSGVWWKDPVKESKRD